MFDPVVDPTLTTKLRAYVALVLERPGFLSRAWMRERNYLAVPVESGMHFTDQDIANILVACRKLGLETAYATAAEELWEFPPFWRLSLDEHGLNRFNFECASLNFMVAPEGLEFVLLCTSDDYFIVAGTRSFVEVVTGTSLEEADRRFRDYAEVAWGGTDQERLFAVADYYSDSQE